MSSFFIAMGKLINLEEYRNNKKIEEDYLKFLTYVNKYLKVPSSIPDLVRCFYFVLRYLEGTVNAFSILCVVKRASEQEITEMKSMVINYLEQIINDLRES